MLIFKSLFLFVERETREHIKDIINEYPVTLFQANNVNIESI